MLITLLAMALIAAGGAAITYLFAKDETMLWRFSAGSVIGSAIFGTLLFAFGMIAGLTVSGVIILVFVTFLPVLLLRRPDIKKMFERDRSRAKGKFQGSGFKKLYRLAYYAFFFLLFVLFFERAMMVTDLGIFTGGSNNFGDLPFHLGAIFSFSDGANFPPQNPSFAGAKFSYPFIPDLITAAFIKLGSAVKDAMLVQNVIWVFSLLIIFERFVLKLIDDRLAAKIAPFILFFSGGFGFVWFFGDYLGQTKGFWEFLNNLPKDYTIGEEFRWGNSLTTLFLTQRSLLLGMPLTLVVLGFIWRQFSDPEEGKSVSRSFLIVGAIAGTLPLIHLHSLFVLSIVGVFILLMQAGRWRFWLVFAAGTAVIAVPELIWSIAGSASNAGEFIGIHFGWDSRGQNFFWFWLKNLGLFIPLFVFGIWRMLPTNKEPTVEPQPTKKRQRPTKKEVPVAEILPTRSLLLFYIPVAVLFVIANTLRLAPWEWDNIKILVYWFALSIPFVAAALVWIFRQGRSGQILAAGCFAVLILAGSLDVWRTISDQINIKIFSPDEIAIAERISARTAPNTVILNAPIHNSAVVLSGRISLMRYPGHLGSHGIDYRQREIDVRTIYAGGSAADELLAKYDIDYVLLSEPERRELQANEVYFSKFRIAAEEGTARLYKVK